MASGETHPPRKNGDVPHSLDRGVRGRTLLTGTDRPVKRGKEHPSRSPSDLVRFAPRGVQKTSAPTSCRGAFWWRWGESNPRPERSAEDMLQA